MPRRRVQVDITAKDKSKAAFGSLQANARRTQAVFSSVGSSLKSIFVPLAGAAGVTAIIRQTSQAMNELDLIAKRARTSGLGTDIFQALGLAAEEANVQQSLLNSSLLAYVKRVGEARAGVGPLVTGLKNADQQLLKNILSTKNQEQALRVLADGIANAESATDKARIANAAFGRSGIEMVRVLGLGSQGLDQTAAKAKELGLIYEKDLLSRQEKLNNDLGVFNKVIGVQFKSILVELAPVLTAVAQKTAEWAKSFRGLFDAMGSGSESRILSIRKEINSLNDELDKGLPKAYASSTIRRIELLKEEEQALLRLMRATAQTVNTAAKANLGGGAFTTSASTDQAAATVSKVVAATKPLQLFKQELSSTKREADTLSDAFSTGMSTIEGAINELVTNGKVNFKSLVSSMLSDFARLATSNLFRSLGTSLLGGGGGLSGLFGGGGAVASSGGLRFGGLFADGGNIKSGEFGIVGERGPEMVRGPANVDPNVGQGSQPGVSIQVNLDARGADASAVAGIGAKLNDFERRLPRIVMGILAEQRRYNPGAV